MNTLTENHTKRITCPFPNNEDGHEATVYLHSHKLWAGIIECDSCGLMDSCEHPSSHKESLQVDLHHGDKDLSYDQEVEVCDACEVTLEVL